MRLERKRLVSTIMFLLLLGLTIAPFVPTADATSWDTWQTKAVGDVEMWQMSSYWIFTSTPYVGYEYKLWSSLMDVIQVKQDLLFNYDQEILFDTYSDAGIMGQLVLESRMEIEDARDLIFRGHFGCKYSYAQVTTVGSVEIFDLTTQSSVWKTDIVTNGYANSWNWVAFSSPGSLGSILSLIQSRDYVIRLRAADAWIQQKVQVAWESAEAWFYSPGYRTLVEYAHDWYGSNYRCYVESDYYFRQGPLDDMLRNHLPYVAGGGLPWGWNPCYLHEFRSEPYTALEYDQWYATTMPGIVGHTWSGMQEQLDDKYDEVEVFTRNPELMMAYYTYDSRIRYVVLETGYVDMTLEAELGNENDWVALVDPPAYAVGWLEIDGETLYHSQSSALEQVFKAAGDMIPSNDSQVIEYREHHSWYDIIVSGVYPHYASIYTRINIEGLKTRADVETLIADMQAEALTDATHLNSELSIPATITFSSILEVNRVLDLIDRYKLVVDSFGFTASDGSGCLRGQGTPSTDESIPLSELMAFIGEYELVGIHRIDVELNPAILEKLIDDESVAVVNFLALVALNNAGIDLTGINEIQWLTEDPSWYINHMFQ